LPVDEANRQFDMLCQPMVHKNFDVVSEALS